MTVLENFPIISQLTALTSDGLPNTDAPYECVSTSLLAGVMYLNGVKEMGGDFTPDYFKDQAYGEAYQGGTSAMKYVDVCAHFGVQLTCFTGNPGALVDRLHQEIARDHPCVVTVPDVYVPSSYNWTHVLACYGEAADTLTMLDPYIAKPITRSNVDWQHLLLENQIWILSKGDEDVIIDITMPAIAAHFSQIDADHWHCKATGKIIQYGILDWYRTCGAKPYGGFSILGLPKSNEQPLQGKAVRQFFERGVLVYDPEHRYGGPEGAGDVYLAQLYEPGSPGVDPAIADLEAQLAALKSQSDDPVLVASLQGKIAAAQKALA